MGSGTSHGPRLKGIPWRVPWAFETAWLSARTLTRRPDPAGSNVSLTLYFIRFGLGLNLALLLIWAVLVLGPFLLHAPPTFRWDQIESYSIKAVAQGFGMDNTFLLYGAT